MRNKVTQRDIAERCGVSLQIVSAVLNNRRVPHYWYSDDTRDKIVSEAERSSYRLNRSASSLVRRRHGAIGIVGGNLYAVPMHILAQLVKAADRHGLFVVLDHQIDSDDKIPLCLREDIVDTILVFEDLTADLERRLEGSGATILHVNSKIPPGKGGILLDEAGAIGMALEHLHGGGCRRTALIHHIPDDRHYSTPERKDAMLCHSRRLGMGHPEFHFWEGRGHEGLRKLAGFLNAHPEIDSLVVTSDGIMSHLQYISAHGHDTGKLEIVGYLNSDFAKANLMSYLHIDGKSFAERIISRACGELGVGTEVERFRYQLRAASVPEWLPSGGNTF